MCYCYYITTILYCEPISWHDEIAGDSVTETATHPCGQPRGIPECEMKFVG